MNERLFLLEPFDTVAYRDGRPFEQSDQGLVEAIGVFPPPPPALAGAVRAAAAACLGVDPGEDWLEQSRRMAAAGDARAEALAELLEGRVSGPFLVEPGLDGKDKLFVPCPFALLFEDEEDTRFPTPLGYLWPASDPPPYAVTETLKARALAVRRFAAAQSGDAEPRLVAGKGHWMRLDELRRFLRTPSQAPQMHTCRRIADFVTPETRVGIAVDKADGRARDGQLYTVVHHRSRHPRQRMAALLATGPAAAAMIGSAVDGIAPLGGESRFGTVTSLAFQADDPGNAGEPARRIQIVALTPVPLDPNQPFGLRLPAGPPFAGLAPVAYAGERPQAIGFIDQTHFSKRPPIRTVRAFPAGATWFLERNSGDPASLADLEGAARGARLAPDDLAMLGFGAFAVGQWPN